MKSKNSIVAGILVLFSMHGTMDASWWSRLLPIANAAKNVCFANKGKLAVVVAFAAAAVAVYKNSSVIKRGICALLARKNQEKIAVTAQVPSSSSTEQIGSHESKQNQIGLPNTLQQIALDNPAFDKLRDDTFAVMRQNGYFSLQSMAPEAYELILKLFKEPRAFCNNSGTVKCLAYSPDGKKLLSVASLYSDDYAGILGDVKYVTQCWDSYPLNLIEDRKLYPECNQSATQPSIKDGVMISKDGKKRLLGGLMLALLEKIKLNYSSLLYALNTSRDRFASVSDMDPSTIELWDTNTGQLLNRFNVEGKVKCLIFSPSGDQLAAHDDDDKGYRWKLIDREKLIRACSSLNLKEIMFIDQLCFEMDQDSKEYMKKGFTKFTHKDDRVGLTKFGFVDIASNSPEAKIFAVLPKPIRDCFIDNVQITK